jgi:hypothetical protein
MNLATRRVKKRHEKEPEDKLEARSGCVVDLSFASSERLR